MSEAKLYGEILAEHSRGHARLFRTNSGMAWQGVIIEKTPTRLVLAHPRPLHMGVPGMADITGWSPLIISEKDVGSLVAIYSAIECKSAKGRTTDEQKSFIELVLRCGGRAGVARSKEDATAILRQIDWLGVV
jgi:hypothetical protein